ncbi:rhodanese-like domain-containing protein [Nocardioidaceae bacterium]|nr:rhodanese-like domain-containing protein [Nocardioidaceae bacterium]
MTDWEHPADAATAAGYFSARLACETDCADVAVARADPDLGGRLVVIDARSADAYAAGHLPGAVRLPEPTVESLAAFGDDALLVTYCWGPHCNGATKLASRIAALGFGVREMLGGVWGWQQEGFELETQS